MGLLDIFKKKPEQSDRYAGKPLLRLVDAFVLKCIGELDASSEAKLRAASLLLLLAPALSAAEAYDSASECSLDAFAAYGQTWSGLPVIPRAISVRPGVDGTLCGLLVDAKRETIEEWYQRHLIKDGWRLAHRHEAAEGVESTLLIFQRGEQTFKLSLGPGLGGTIVLMFKPEPNKAMEPTR